MIVLRSSHFQSIGAVIWRPLMGTRSLPPESLAAGCHGDTLHNPALLSGKPSTTKPNLKSLHFASSSRRMSEPLMSRIRAPLVMDARFSRSTSCTHERTVAHAMWAVPWRRGAWASDLGLRLYGDHFAITLLPIHDELGLQTLQHIANGGDDYGPIFCLFFSSHLRPVSQAPI